MSIVGSLMKIAKTLNNGTAISAAGSEEALEFIAGKLTNAAAADMSEYAKKSDIAGVYKYKGTKETYSALPASGNTAGDVYNIETADAEHGVKAGDNVAWNGTGWDVLAGDAEVRIHFATESDTTTSDVTYAAIVAAITAGKDVVAFYGDAMSNSVAYDSVSNKVTAVFIGIASTTMTVTTLELASDDTVTKTEASYTLTAAV